MGSLVMMTLEVINGPGDGGDGEDRELLTVMLQTKTIYRLDSKEINIK